MLFRKDIEPACAYCKKSAPIDDNSAICVKKGIVTPWNKCGGFVYDPLKRKPELPLTPMTDELDPESFITT